MKGGYYVITIRLSSKMILKKVKKRRGKAGGNDFRKRCFIPEQCGFSDARRRGRDIAAGCKCFYCNTNLRLSILRDLVGEKIEKLNAILSLTIFFVLM